MRYITIITLLFSTIACAQNKDTRAELEIKGRINEISVSPSEQIWLTTATGNTYYTENIESDWHYGTPLFETEDDFRTSKPHLDRISFFNEKKAIISGYIAEEITEPRKNGYYLTGDAGKTWRLKDYGGGSWIYTADSDKDGNIWLGGSSKELYFSGDFGETWETIKIPFKSSDRIYGIHMMYGNIGIIGSDENEILTTSDNWKTVRYFETPFQQKKYTNERKGYADNRISKIYFWGNFVVINQKNNIFYSEISEINWKSFPIKIIDFEIDRDSKDLFAVTDELNVVCFTSPEEYDNLSNKTLSSPPLNLKVVNHSLYVIDNYYEVYKVNQSEFIHSIPYTTDKKIPTPRIINQHKKLTWGFNGNQIYLSENDGAHWYRENVIDISVEDFQLKSDSTAILWDGKNNYSYSLGDKSPKFYTPNEPLKSFFSTSLQSLTIDAGSQGCFHSIGNKIDYKTKNSSILSVRKISGNDNEVSKFKNEVSSSLLTEILENINTNPSVIPSLQDFKITHEDKQNYISLVDERIKSNNGFLDKNKKAKKAFYYNIPKMIDTLDTKIIDEVLNQQEGIWSTTSNWFNIQITNQNQDTLKISRGYFANSLPWHLPWQFKYNGQYFNSYNINFSKFIDSCLPENFSDKEIFDNKYLLMEIADYMYERNRINPLWDSILNNK